MASSLFSALRSHIRNSISQFPIHRRLPLITIINRPPSISSSSPNLPPPDCPFSRCFSTLRRQPDRPKKLDIGAKARQLQNRRLWGYTLTISCIAGFVIIVLNNFSDQLVFYVTPTEALEKFQANPSKNRFRLGGLVLEGSVTHPASSPEMEFVVTDLITDILVKYEGSLPDLFREGHSAIVEGFVYPLTDEVRGKLASAGKPVSDKARSIEFYFQGTEVLAKHDEKYMPKEVAAALERNKAKLKEEEEAKSVEEKVAES
ncbi:CcmE/CycJ protein [Macleaya cordata]|uniref:CcmE/CycJ protein n=1 Tax=Macleaya cordata TaxID=56857 RepID=A0A200QPA9_MACCD|nr:CcmE/CycJ protein [Macleaya cordata]